ncbi:InlB B-repeat-containing protein [Bifidobacterium vespertilionis]|uniref:InlB B-repeat-containing protein n=1 Tax=Bifidobacterium vespertilionis TaxID=2562524 RepID=UPI001CC29E0A|nr:InlB B-repeat-containing protein [Bifidobacterium vespertilionis]
MTGNNKFWRASLAGLASVAMLATMGVAASTANAAGADRADFTDNGAFAVKVAASDTPYDLHSASSTASGLHYGQLVYASDVTYDKYAAAGDGKVLTGYSYDRAGEKPVTFPFVITGDTKLYAQYADAVKVTFVDAKDTLSTADDVTLDSFDVAKGDALTQSEYWGHFATEPSYAGKDFVGWTKTNAPTADDLYTTEKLESNTTLYTRYDAGQNLATVKFEKAGNSFNVTRYTLADAAFPEFRAPKSVEQENFKEFQVDGKKYDFTQKVANSNDDPFEADLTITAAAYSADESVDVHYFWVTDETSKLGTITATKADYTTSADEKVAQPSDPAVAKAYFTGWYTDASLKTPFDFSKAIKDQPGYVAGKHEITLYAGWDTTNIARRVYNLNYDLWSNAQQIQYVDARGQIALLNDLENYTQAQDGSVNAVKLAGWKINGTSDTIQQVPDEQAGNTVVLDAVWKQAVAVKLNADGGYFSNNSHYKYVLATVGDVFADAEGYEVPTKDGFTFKYWTIVDNAHPTDKTKDSYFNKEDKVTEQYNTYELRANYEATGVLSVESLHNIPSVIFFNKVAAYDQYKVNGYTQDSWKTYVDTWYDLQDEWFNYLSANSHQDQINKGNALAKKYADAQAKLVKSDVPVKPAPATKVPVYRLYNKYITTGTNHLFTTDKGEYDSLVAKGWLGEGEVFQATSDKNATPVYRLYNKYDGSHHYTKDAAERDNLVKLGWTYEFVGFYAPADGDATLYRLYNQYNGEHLFTTDKAENDKLVSLGWTAEESGLKVYSAAK